MTLSECQVGARVRCVHATYYGSVGYITDVFDYTTQKSKYHYFQYEVRDEFGVLIGGSWCHLDSWELYPEPESIADLLGESL